MLADVFRSADARLLYTSWRPLIACSSRTESFWVFSHLLFSDRRPPSKNSRGHDNGSNRGGVVFSGGGAGRVWCALAEADSRGSRPGRCLEQGCPLSFHSRDRAIRTRALRNRESRCVVVVFRRDFAVQWKFVCDGADECSLVGRDHAAGRSVFSGGLGVAGYFAYKIGAVDSFDARSLTLSGFPVYVARLPPAPFTEPIRAGLAFAGD